MWRPTLRVLLGASIALPGFLAPAISVSHQDQLSFVSAIQGALVCSALWLAVFAYGLIVHRLRGLWLVAAPHGLFGGHMLAFRLSNPVARAWPIVVSSIFIPPDPAWSRLGVAAHNGRAIAFGAPVPRIVHRHGRRYGGDCGNLRPGCQAAAAARPPRSDPAAAQADRRPASPQPMSGFQGPLPSQELGPRSGPSGHRPWPCLQGNRVKEAMPGSLPLDTHQRALPSGLLPRAAAFGGGSRGAKPPWRVSGQRPDLPRFTRARDPG